MRNWRWQKEDGPQLVSKVVKKAWTGAKRTTQISSSLLGFTCETYEQHVTKLSAAVGEVIVYLGNDQKISNKTGR